MHSEPNRSSRQQDLADLVQDLIESLHTRDVPRSRETDLDETSEIEILDDTGWSLGG